MTPARQKGLRVTAGLLDLGASALWAQTLVGQALWCGLPLAAAALVGFYILPRPRARGVLLTASLLTCALSTTFAFLLGAVVDMDVPRAGFFLVCPVSFFVHRLLLRVVSRRLSRTAVAVVGRGAGTRHLRRLVEADEGGLCVRPKADIVLVATTKPGSPRAGEIVIPFHNGLPTERIELPGGHRLHLFETCAEGQSGRVKRIVDLLLALLALPILLPAAGLCALITRVVSGPPAVHSQVRLTLNDKPFRIWKIRTMVPDAEPGGNPVWPRAHDDRATPLGSLLRRFWLDETPQILNVLRGDVSWVGPRPERPAFAQVLSESIPTYSQRHRVKGGLTGLAQIEGYVGNTSLRRRVAHDLAYIRRWSPWLDVKIVLGTLCQIARRKIRPTVDYAPGQPGRVP